MAFFITKEGKRKSPMALILFFVVLADCGIFAILYATLSSFLFYHIEVVNPIISAFIHSGVIGSLGSLICCLLFFLPDKRIVPYAFSASAIVPFMILAASMQLPADRRVMILYAALLYTGMPILIGNLISWAVYLLKFKAKKGGRNG